MKKEYMQIATFKGMLNTVHKDMNDWLKTWFDTEVIDISINPILGFGMFFGIGGGSSDNFIGIIKYNCERNIEDEKENKKK